MVINQRNRFEQPNEIYIFEIIYGINWPAMFVIEKDTLLANCRVPLAGTFHLAAEFDE